MNTVQPALDAPSTSLAEWWNDAIDLVQRVNARLRSDPVVIADGPRLRHGRRVLSDRQCQVLAGLALDEDVAATLP